MTESCVNRQAANEAKERKAGKDTIKMQIFKQKPHKHERFERKPQNTNRIRGKCDSVSVCVKINTQFSGRQAKRTKRNE